MSSQQTQQRSNRVTLSVQIKADRHGIKADCGVGVAAVGFTSCDILVLVGVPANKSGNRVF
jgi:hypothetical protein